MLRLRRGLFCWDALNLKGCGRQNRRRRRRLPKRCRDGSGNRHHCETNSYFHRSSLLRRITEPWPSSLQ